MIAWFLIAVIAAVAAAICLTFDPRPGSHPRFLAGVCVIVAGAALIAGFVAALQ